MKPLTHPIPAALCTLALLGLSACSGGTAQSMLPKNADPYTQAIAQTQDDLLQAEAQSAPKTSNRVLDTVRAMASAVPSGDVDTPTVITGLGYSQVATQPGKTLNERRLLAIRAARLEAMRDLTEQVYGIHLTSETTVRDTVTRNDVIQGKIQGVLRGARTARITPKDNDTFEVVLELDPSTVAYIVRAASKGL